MKVVLLSRDLMFISRVKEVAAAHASEAIIAKSEEGLQVATEVREACGGVLLIDLEKCPLAPEVLRGAIGRLNQDAWRCIGFFSHVHLEVADQARQMGLSEVVPRSKFVQLLPGLFGS